MAGALFFVDLKQKYYREARFDPCDPGSKLIERQFGDLNFLLFLLKSLQMRKRTLKNQQNLVVFVLPFLDCQHPTICAVGVSLKSYMILHLCVVNQFRTVQ